MPGERHSQGPPIPDVGVVVAASDPAKSQLLWDQLLSIPSRVMGSQVPEPTRRTIAAVVRGQHVPDARAGVNIHVVTLDHSIVIAPTERAIAASIEAFRSGDSILSDAGVKAATGQMTDDTSILIFAHAGRCAQVAAQFCPPSEMGEVQMVGAVAGSTVATVLVDESPTRFRLAANVTGLPKVKDVIQMVSKVMGQQGLVSCDGSGQEPPSGAEVERETITAIP